MNKLNQLKVRHFTTKYHNNFIVLVFLVNFALSIGLFFSNVSHATPLSPSIERKTFNTSDGVQLHYLIGGSGDKTLVFIPGWLMPAEIFNSQLNYFSQKYRVISLDPRSQGKSDIYIGKNLAEVRTRDIDELIKATNTKQFVLIGWSLGVMESIDFVKRYDNPGLESLVLIDNSIGEGTPPKPSKKKRSKKPMSSNDFVDYVKGFVKAIFKTQPDPEFVQTVEKSALRLADNPQNAFYVLSKPYPREYYRETLYSKQIPIWYAITPRYAEQGEIFSTKHPMGSMTIYNNAGHALFVDNADEFNRDLENFLRKK